MTASLDILKKCQRGDSAALTTLYEIYSSRVMGLSVRYSKNRADAEDIFQESFIRVFQGVRKVNNLESFDGWLTRTVVNTAINYYHKTKRHKDNEFLFTDSYVNEDYQLMVDHLDQEVVMGMIQRLPDGYRIVFNLYVIDGYSHPEIAQMMGCSEGNSKSQLSRAKSILKKELEKIGVDKYVKHA